MEVVLLWLDDLDDVVFTAALAWERLRTLVLQVGLLAAVTVAGSELAASADLFSAAAAWTPPLARVALACVAAWFCGATFVAAYARNAEAVRRAA